MSSTTATNLAGLVFGELAAAVQGTWQAMAAGHGDPRPRQQHPKLGSEKQKASAQGAAAIGAKAAKEGDDVGRCGGAMSDTTVYLLLDRFAPS
ncbi:hypothetical protein BAE44_0004936 [Dichanthelium oligosanthes]|uniref:Uncharacterized protein n=1 Tax=Dichanthelium oligosanthes TaxID=888268 RepID=A0A1E5W9E7_9POAL|nr:hypothetical protein BAE44_0004936 [Dichanthelium oligosanthes]